MDGAAVRPLLKTSRMAFSDSPSPFAEDLRTLDGDEVSFTLSGNSSRKHRLTAPGRSEEQNALWRPDSNSDENLGLLNGPFDGFLKLLLDTCQPADVSSVDGGHFNVDLAHGGGCYFPVGVHEVAQVHFHLFKHHIGDSFLRQVDLWKVTSQCFHRGLSAEG